MISRILLLVFAGIDLYVLARGGPPMWREFHGEDHAGWGVLQMALKILESLFLVSLFLSAVLLALRSRWAVVLGVAQLPVRILCGYSLTPIFGLAGLLGMSSLPSLPWLPLIVFLELGRIVLTAVAVRSGEPASSPGGGS